MIRCYWAGALCVSLFLVANVQAQSATAPAAPRDYPAAQQPRMQPLQLWPEAGTVSLTPNLPGRPAPQRPRITLVVDIDETLSITDYNSLYWGIGSDDSRPLRGAPETMRLLSRDYHVVYLTARPNSLARKTLRWLSAQRFPLGEVLTAPSLFSHQPSFKDRALRRLRSSTPNVLIGIGDKNTDAASYRAHGMLSVVVNPWDHQRYRPDDIVLADWQDVGAFFRRNQELLTDATRLAGEMRDGRLGRRLQRSMFN